MLALLLLLAAPQVNAAGIKPSSETTPTLPLPPANPLPLADPDVANVMAPVNAALAGIAAHDAGAVRAVIDPDGGATVVSDQPGGSVTVKHLSWDDFLAGLKPSTDTYEERLTDPAVETDGDVAMVWSPYVFYLNGKAHHCGTDHFDLIHQATGWKLLNVTWSQHTTNCGASS
jgi:hypothetical protein